MTRREEQELVSGPQAPLRAGVLAMLIGNLCLAFGPWFVRLADTGPVASGFWRIALAVPLLFLVARISGDPAKRPDAGLFWLFLLSGLFFAADLAAWHVGILQTKLANANLLGNSTSLLLPIYAFAVARAWPTRGQGLALLLAGGGAALLLGRSFELSAANLVGDLLCILAGVFYTAYLVVMARARETEGQWPALAWSTLLSAPPLLLCAVMLGEQVMPTDWTPLIALAVLSQVIGQGLMIYAIGRVPPLLFGLMLLLQPVVAAAIGWAVYDERLGAADIMGAALIAAALVLVRLVPDRAAAT